MIGRTPLYRFVSRCIKAAHAANHQESGLNETASPQLPRRAFLKYGSVAGLGFLTSTLAMGQDAPAKDEKASTANKPEGKTEGKPVDKGPVVIVGGGIAGLTAAYRLSQKGVEVHLYEASNRFGGRMWTKKDFNADHMFVELGGELVDTNHTELIELAKELGVEIQPLKEGEKGVDYYHIEGKTYTDKDLIPVFQPLAKRLAEAADGIEDDKGEYTEKAQKLDATSLAQWLKANSEGVPAWLVKMLDVAYTCEFGLECDQQSSLNLIDVINPDTSKGFEIFGESDEAWRIKGGNETLPRAVTKAIEGKVKTHLQHSLTAMKDDGKELTLTFEVVQGKYVSVKSARAILAIPFTILRGVKGWDSLKLSDEKKKVIKEMAYGTNVKLMLGFKDRVWRKLDPMCNGSVITDLNFQQCWETSRGQDGSGGILTNFLGGKIGADFGPAHIKSVVGAMDKVFPGLKASFKPDEIANSNWPKIKFIKASYSLTGVGQYCSFYETACVPELDGRLLFAGEHTSIRTPAYMNGGVETGNRVAREYLGEPAPEEKAEEPADQPTDEGKTGQS